MSTSPVRLVPWVAAGGALGTAARLAVDLLVGSPVDGWQAGVTVVNLTGAFLLGLVTRYPFRGRRPHALRAAVGTGFLGAYTTFSALFATVATGSTLAAALDLGLSIGGGLLAAWLGVQVITRLTDSRREPDHDAVEL